jgi:hypothetical protein
MRDGARPLEGFGRAGLQRAIPYVIRVVVGDATASGEAFRTDHTDIVQGETSLVCTKGG